MLAVDRVRRSFGSVEAVRDVSLRVEPGTIVGLLGPNGAGKTTTMRMILGLYAPDGGRITWHDRDVDLRVRRRFGYLPEERGLYGKMNVVEQLTYFGRLHGVSSHTALVRARRWMDALGIARYATRTCNELSKGNQQKVQMASALIHAPELLVLDEPFSGLDPSNAQTMLDVIRTLADEGAALVLSSHQMFVIEDACRTFSIVDGGVVRAAGTLAALRTAFPTRIVRVAPDIPAIRAAFARAGCADPMTATGALEYEVPASTDFAALLHAASAAGPLESFERREPSLGRIYARALAPVA